jgi:predicted lipoprotein with Yx(FWY)xxD motif
MIRWTSLLLSCVAVLAWAVLPAAAQTTIIVAQSDKHKSYLTDIGGRPVYLFTVDSQGSGTARAVSKCYDTCAQTWPPVITEGQPKPGPQVQASMLGTMERQDGKVQVTYNGWPLYYFTKDQPQGQPTGQDIKSFGGEWYLVQPQGIKVAEK